MPLKLWSSGTPIRKPTLADWGIGMTVCIMALCEGAEKIVAMSDHMLCTEGWSADNVSLKSEPIHRNWYALWSGDAFYAPFILERAKSKLWRGHNWSDNEVAEQFCEAANEILEREVANRVLKRHGFTQDSFRKQGKKLLSPQQHDHLFTKIEEIELGTEFMVGGFDKNGEGHIFAVEKDLSAKSCDSAGFWAIGEGSNNALSTIFFHAKYNQFNQNSPLSDCLYVMAEAKFTAESASAVGKKTFGTIYENNQHIGYIPASAIHNLHEHWFTELAPKLRRGIGNELKAKIERLTPLRSPSVSQKSEPEQ